jgi:hypothetical protein
MGMEIVNGYVCRDCTDVERAKKGDDPAQPKGAVGSVTDPLAVDGEPRGENRPLAFGDRGTRLNVLL